jgi:hypothetical protein
MSFDTFRIIAVSAGGPLVIFTWKWLTNLVDKHREKKATAAALAKQGPWSPLRD